MTISGITNDRSLSGVNAPPSLPPAGAHMPPPMPMGAQFPTDDSAEVSGPGQLMSKLEQLKSKDPDKFKEVVAGIAEKLKAAAEDEDLESESSMLSDLADRFSEVAESGDLSQLQPPPPPPPPGQGRAMSAGYAQPDQAPVSGLAGSRSTPGGPNETMDDLFQSIEDALVAALESDKD